jgi:hypothetical protein
MLKARERGVRLWLDTPVTGIDVEMITDLILQGHSDLIDASQLSVERFARGQLLEETAVL